MLPSLIAACLPVVLLGHLAGFDHIMLQLQHRRTCDTYADAGSAPVWDSVDGGTNRACRGVDSTDRGSAGSEYAVFTSAMSLDACKARCLDTSGCKGIEYSAGRCEVWRRPGGITTSAGVRGYTCLRLVRERPAFTPADGGADRVCRGADAHDRGIKGVDYVIFPKTVTLAGCKGHCAATTSCNGIEFKPGHCEVWIRAGGIGSTAKAAGFTCLRYSGGAVPITGKGVFEPVDGGMDRACCAISPCWVPRQGGKEGEDFTLEGSVGSLNECKARCEELGAACKGIEFSPGGCEIWTRAAGIATSAPVKNSVCLRYRPASDPRACGAFRAPQEGTDLAGALLAAVHGETQEACCLACTTASGCEGFAYVADAGMCYLKANVTATFAKAGVTTQVRHMPASDLPTCEGFGELQADRDVAGNELDQAQAISAEYCCAACRRASGCQGFTYLAENQICYLKANITGTYANPGRVSRMKPILTTQPPTVQPGSCEGYGTLMRNTDVGGLQLGQVQVRTVDECCGACEEATHCEGFAYLEELHTCFLKASITGTYPKEGPMVRLKWRLQPEPEPEPEVVPQPMPAQFRPWPEPEHKPTPYPTPYSGGQHPQPEPEPTPYYGGQFPRPEPEPMPQYGQYPRPEPRPTPPQYGHHPRPEPQPTPYYYGQYPRPEPRPTPNYYGGHHPRPEPTPMPDYVKYPRPEPQTMP